MKLHVRLAKALQLAAEQADGNVVRGRDLPSAHRTLLIRSGFLIEILKGWYFFQNPDSPMEPLRLWRDGFWHFLDLHLASRGGYCLGPENSLDLLSGQREPPAHVTAHLTSGGNNTVRLRLGGANISCTLLTYPASYPAEVEIIVGVRSMPTGFALARASPKYFQKYRDRIEHLLSATSACDLAKGILDADVETGAKRILGALEATGLTAKANEVRSLIAETGWKSAVNRYGPELQGPTPTTVSDPRRNIRRYWQEMRGVVLETFPLPSHHLSPKPWLDRARRLLIMDAYHTLSMDGYELSPTDVECITRGETPRSLDPKTCLSVKGYLAAHAAVLTSIRENFATNQRGGNLISEIFRWYAEFQKSIGALPFESLPSGDVQSLTDAIEQEPFASARAILSHALVLKLLAAQSNRHAIAGLSLNALFATERYPWTILRVGRTKEYLAALEIAPTDIEPLAAFIWEEMNNRWE